MASKWANSMMSLAAAGVFFGGKCENDGLSFGGLMVLPTAAMMKMKALKFINTGASKRKMFKSPGRKISPTPQREFDAQYKKLGASIQNMRTLKQMISSVHEEFEKFYEKKKLTPRVQHYRNLLEKAQRKQKTPKTAVLI